MYRQPTYGSKPQVSVEQDTRAAEVGSPSSQPLCSPALIKLIKEERKKLKLKSNN